MVLVEIARRCGVYTYELNKPWGRLDSLDDDDDVFEIEAIKEEFAYRTHVAIALANYALESKKGVQHRVDAIPEYVCPELREIMWRLGEAVDHGALDEMQPHEYYEEYLDNIRGPAPKLEVEWETELGKR